MTARWWKRALGLLTSIAALILLWGTADAHTLKVSDRTYVNFEELLGDLKKVSIVYIGELHGKLGHQEAQLQILSALHESGKDVVVAVEMFRKENQSILDRWVSGEISREAFVDAYKKNWGMWPRYRPIFDYARVNKIPMLGLNLPRDITAQVAKNGFASLDEQQIDRLPPVQCHVDPRYEEFIRKAMGLHNTNGQGFRNFCEAQLLWDKAMAASLIEYLNKSPESVIVVLAGSGHSWKYGIPAQVSAQSDYPFRVLMPEIDGRLVPESVTVNEVDYLMLGLEQGPMH